MILTHLIAAAVVIATPGATYAATDHLAERLRGCRHRRATRRNGAMLRRPTTGGAR